MVGTRAFAVFAREAAFGRAAADANFNVSRGKGIGEAADLLVQCVILLFDLLKAAI